MTAPTWTTACPDWESRIVAGRSLVPCPPLFPAEAEDALRIFRELRIVNAPGSPTIGMACRQWVFDFAGAVFGAYDAQTGERLIQHFLLLVSKKNSKSTIAAGIMITALLRNWRESGEFVILAPTIEVAHNSFDPARDMIRRDEELSALLHVNSNTRTITHRNTDATLKVVAADSETVTGKNASVLVDELWLFGKRANAENMLREATGGLASRPEGFVIYLSTQSDEPPAGVFRAKLNEFRDIRDGRVKDPKSMGVLYEFPERMIASNEFRQHKNFYITNPNLGASVSESYLIDEFDKAVRAGEQSLRGWIAKYLDVEINMSLRGDRWAGAEFWEKQADAELSALAPFEALEAIISRCETFVVGIDGGGLDDLFGFSVVGRDPTSIDVKTMVNGREVITKMKRWWAWSHAWCHEGVLKRRQSIASKLEDFQKAGELTIVDNDLGDIGAIVEVIRQIKDDHGKLAAVAVDPAGLGEFVDALAKIDVTQENKLLVGVRQGYAMMNAIKTAERRLANDTLRHCGGAMMGWCISNLKIEPLATAIRATKQHAGDAKIDPVMALFDAVAIMQLNPESSVYSSDERPDGLLVLGASPR